MAGGHGIKGEGYGTRLEINGAVLDQMDRELANLQVLHRAPALKKAMKATVDIPAKRLREILPPPGYPGDKPGLRPLRETVKTKVVEYSSGKLVGVMGFDYNRGGQHGHLLEEGHRIVVGGTAPTRPGKGRKTLRRADSGQRGGGTVQGFVEGRHYIETAVESTKDAQNTTLLGGIDQAVRESRVVRAA